LFDLDIKVEYFKGAEEADNPNSVTLFDSQEEQAEEGNEFTQLFRMTHNYTKSDSFIYISYYI